jgi:tetratricopeptide (TPR) repeat protein
MTSRRFHVLTIAAACVLACASASAELNLWISYYYHGENNYQAGEFVDSDILLETAREEHCRDCDAAHRLAANLDHLGMTNMALENYEESEKYLKCALDLKETKLGKRSRFVPKTLNNLGDLYFVTNDIERAERMYRRALDLNRRDQLNIEVCRSLNGMALIHNERSEYVQAEELLKRAIDIHERHLRRWHPYLATVSVNLGALYVNLGRYEEAEPLFDKAQFIQEKALGGEHPDVALRLSAQAALYAKLGKYSKAAALQEEADEMNARFARVNDKSRLDRE